MKLPFSETWLINLVSRPDRYEKMRKKIDYFGWEVKDHRTVIHPWCGEIAKNFNATGKGYLNSPNAFSCTREHYTLIKSAFLRGLESICVMEDDVSFNSDIKVWEEYMSNLPEDWSILRLCSLRGKNEQDIIETEYNESTMWAPVSTGMWGTGCYALNRLGMEYMIKSIEAFMQPIDLPLYRFEICPEVKHYLPKIPLGLCLTDSLVSDINPNSECNFYYKEITNVSLSDYI